MKTALDQLRNLFQSRGFNTRTYINSDDSSRWWVLEIIRQGEVRSAMVFDYETEEMLTIA